MHIRRGRAVTAGFTLIELMIVVAIVAILAMVAIPAFVKYIRRSKTTEATMNIRKMYDASVAYYSSERALRGGMGGQMVPRRFPLTWCGMTCPVLIPEPQQLKCCQQPGGKCPPMAVINQQNPGAAPWINNCFTSISFGLDDPFYFHYGYRSSGTEREAMFTAGAYGDLDCDDEWSTYERAGSVDSLFNVVGGGLYINNDIE